MSSRVFKGSVRQFPVVYLRTALVGAYPKYDNNRLMIEEIAVDVIQVSKPARTTRTIGVPQRNELFGLKIFTC